MFAPRIYPTEVKPMRKKDAFQNVGMGVGYVSVMLVFAVICLTIFAVLSLRAAMSTDSFNERSGEFMRQYYAADSSAKKTLSLLDECAYNAGISGFFEDEFAENAQSIEGVSVRAVQKGFSVSYTVGINDRQELFVNVIFDSSGEYTIEQWKSREIYAENSDSHLGVWDGTF